VHVDVNLAVLQGLMQQQQWKQQQREQQHRMVHQQEVNKSIQPTYTVCAQQRIQAKSMAGASTAASGRQQQQQMHHDQVPGYCNVTARCTHALLCFQKNGGHHSAPFSLRRWKMAHQFFEQQHWQQHSRP
jgi:hypothetical protein